MRLADLIVANGRKRQKSDAARLAAAVVGSQHFELAQTAQQVIATLAFNSPGNRLRAAMQLSRLPFHSMWVEWVGPSASGRRENSEAPGDGVTPRRCGFLFEAIDASLQRGMVSMAWSIPTRGGDQLNISPLCATFDWSPSAASVPTIKPTTAGDVRDARGFAGKFFKAMSDDEVFDHLSRVGIIENPRSPEAAEYLAALKAENFSAFAQAQSQLFRDWDGEMKFAQAILVCLNSKNMTSRTPTEDMGDVNKARQRVGRPPLLGFSTVQINLSGVMKRKIGSDPTGEKLRAHIVRGHFKIRRTGIFWWSPFMRGDASLGVVARAGYTVSGASA